MLELVRNWNFQFSLTLYKLWKRFRINEDSEPFGADRQIRTADLILTNAPCTTFSPKKFSFFVAVFRSLSAQSFALQLIQNFACRSLLWTLVTFAAYCSAHFSAFFRRPATVFCQSIFCELFEALTNSRYVIFLQLYRIFFAYPSLNVHIHKT